MAAFMRNAPSPPFRSRLFQTAGIAAIYTPDCHTKQFAFDRNLPHAL